MPARSGLEDRALDRLSKSMWGGLPLVAAGLALAAVAAAFWLRDDLARSAWSAIAAGCAVLVLIALVRARAVREDRRDFRGAVQFMAADPGAVVLTDEAGSILASNGHAGALIESGLPRGAALSDRLSARLADPAAAVRSLLARAAESGAAVSEPMRPGGLRMAAHRVGPGLIAWRLEEAPEADEPATALPMLTVSKSGTILYMNEALRRMVGRRPRTLEDLLVEDGRPGGPARWIETADGQVAVDVREIAGTAGRREVYLLPVVRSEAVAAVGADQFDALPVALLRIGEGGRVLGGNRLARELTGSDLAGEITLGELVEGLGRSVDGWVDAALAGMNLGHPETLRARKRQAETHLQITLGRVEGPDGPSLVAVLNDATELKTLEAQFVQSQKMQAIGQLAGGIAHDFNNLLTAISGHCDLLMLRHDQGDPDYADLSQISQNANRAAALVGQLLAFSRKQTQTLETLDLRETLADLAHLLNRLVGEKVSLSLRHDPALSPMRGDRRQLEQVILNLVVNARDALGEDGGEVAILTSNCRLIEPLERDSAEVPPGRYVKVQVRDEGSGIDPAKLPKIFEPFFTTKRQGEGTGLGLSTAYGIVKQTGGFIFVDSELGKGTVFTLYFPAAREALRVAPPEVAPRAAARTEGQQGVILLVEDEAPVRAFASRALRLRGYTVIEADCAEAALEIAADESVGIDVFVTDVIMPGLDGPTWVRRALETRAGTPVVFVSGYAEDALEGSSESIPGSVFLPKPFSLNALTETVEVVLTNGAALKSPEAATRAVAAPAVEA